MALDTTPPEEPVYGFLEKDVKRIKSAVERTESNPLKPVKGTITRPAPDTVIGRITGGEQPYSWTQQRQRMDGSTEDMPNGITGDEGTPRNEAYEINGDIAIHEDTIVTMYQAVVMDDTTPRVVWCFDGAGHVAAGQYLGMTYQIVAANTGGWDWEHAHSLLP